MLAGGTVGGERLGGKGRRGVGIGGGDGGGDAGGKGRRREKERADGGKRKGRMEGGGVGLFPLLCGKVRAIGGHFVGEVNYRGQEGNVQAVIC